MRNKILFSLLTCVSLSIGNDYFDDGFLQNIKKDKQQIKSTEVVEALPNVLYNTYFRNIQYKDLEVGTKNIICNTDFCQLEGISFSNRFLSGNIKSAKIWVTGNNIKKISFSNISANGEKVGNITVSDFSQLIAFYDGVYNSGATLANFSIKIKDAHPNSLEKTFIPVGILSTYGGKVSGDIKQFLYRTVKEENFKITEELFFDSLDKREFGVKYSDNLFSFDFTAKIQEIYHSDTKLLFFGKSDILVNEIKIGIDSSKLKSELKKNGLLSQYQSEAKQNLKLLIGTNKKNSESNTTKTIEFYKGPFTKLASLEKTKAEITVKSKDKNGYNIGAYVFNSVFISKGMVSLLKKDNFEFTTKYKD